MQTLALFFPKVIPYYYICNGSSHLGKGTPLFLNQTEAKGPRGRDTVLYAKYMLECVPCRLKVRIRH